MIPIEGEPADMMKLVEDYGAWLAQTDLPKLFINGDPGSIPGRIRRSRTPVGGDGGFLSAVSVNFAALG
jgi:hypothetical protein